MGEAGQLLLYRQKESRGAAGDLNLAIELLQGTRLFRYDHALNSPQDFRRRGHTIPAANAQAQQPGATGPMLRIYRPQPTVAFGQRDQKLPGYEAAAQACREHGFEPLVRRAGGRAAAYHPGSLVVDHIEPDPDPIRETQARFSAFGDLLAGALMRCGVDAKVGEIPGEYCAGEHSVHGVHPHAADVRIKIVGTAQRQIATGWLFSSSIVVEDGYSVRRVLSAAYEAMGLEWDPLTAGAADDLVPGLTRDEVEAAVIESYREHWTLTEGEPPMLEA